ncbi:hypothetical protein J0A68_20940 [Algoriphagus sp. H41]|uniref:Secreted protein n=1 Tax=Algoriphagus oliviformis TaxID=2811231 RepID=A0ABS3C9F2_9BACT|nr:DUF6520 family protein [Algoriphagus oliviformis]MBN7813435.1 hypothetical protein [Algoriphagus oliviformis]
MKRLPLLAFVLAATIAFAFSPKGEDSNQYGHDSTQWINVTGVTPGPTTYTCDAAVSEHCLYDAPNGNPLNPGENKMFVNRGIAPLK